MSAEEAQQCTGSHGGAYHASHVGSHGVHKQVVVAVILQSEVVGNTCRHRHGTHASVANEWIYLVVFLEEQVHDFNEYHTADYPAQADWTTQLISQTVNGGGNELDEQLRRNLGALYEPFVLVRTLNEQSPIQARIPFILNMK